MSETYTLDIDSDRGKLLVSWNDLDTLAKYAGTQAGFYLDTERDLFKLHDKHFKEWNQMFWSQRQNLKMFDFPDNAKIVDIGAGVAVVDLLLYSYIPNSQFYLIDKEVWELDKPENSPPLVSFSKKYPRYNTWSPVKDAISTSKFDLHRFNFLDTEDTFPKDVDVVMSYLSWCFHYPKEIYWDQVMANLKTNGKLVLDVRPMHDQDVIGEISEQLKCDPIKFAFPKLPDFVDTFIDVEEDASGYRCCWIKKV
jgi:hypothetical protein